MIEFIVWFTHFDCGLKYNLVLELKPVIITIIINYSYIIKFSLINITVNNASTI